MMDREAQYAPADKVALYRRLFASPDGEQVLADLRAQFYDQPMQPKSEIEAGQLLGGRDVVRYVMDMRKGLDDGG